MKVFIQSQFNYCPLIWRFDLRTMNKKINRIYEKALRLFHFYYSSSFDELVKKNESFSCVLF